MLSHYQQSPTVFLAMLPHHHFASPPSTADLTLHSHQRWPPMWVNSGTGNSAAIPAPPPFPGEQAFASRLHLPNSGGSGGEHLRKSCASPGPEEEKKLMHRRHQQQRLQEVKSCSSASSDDKTGSSENFGKSLADTVVVVS